MREISLPYKAVVSQGSGGGESLTTSICKSVMYQPLASEDSWEGEKGLSNLSRGPIDVLDVSEASDRRRCSGQPLAFRLISLEFSSPFSILITRFDLYWPALVCFFGTAFDVEPALFDFNIYFPLH